MRHAFESCTMHSVLVTQQHRSAVVRQLGFVRYGVDDCPIDQSTLWRWCDALSIPTGQEWFSAEQFALLLLLAKWLRKPKSSISQFVVVHDEVIRREYERIRNQRTA